VSNDWEEIESALKLAEPIAKINLKNAAKAEGGYIAILGESPVF